MRTTEQAESGLYVPGSTTTGQTIEEENQALRQLASAMAEKIQAQQEELDRFYAAEVKFGHTLRSRAGRRAAVQTARATRKGRGNGPSGPSSKAVGRQDAARRQRILERATAARASTGDR